VKKIQTKTSSNPLLDTILIQDMLDAYLVERNALESAKKTKRDKPYVYPSMIGNCTRQQVYKMCGYEEPVSPQLARIFDYGNKMHDRYQAYFADMGLLSAENTEVPFRSDEYRVSGRIDGILYAPDGQWKCILELKSANKQSFTEMATMGPLRQHVMQVMLYMTLTPIKESLIFVECKDNQKVAAYPVTYAEEQGAEVLQRVRLLTDCADARILPPREYAPSSKQCYWCYYKAMCADNKI